MSFIGYARGSMFDQDAALLLDARAAVGVHRVFEERGVSGAKVDRPGLSKALTLLRAGDALVVWKADRSGRSMTHLAQTMAELEGKASVLLRNLEMMRRA